MTVPRGVDEGWVDEWVAAWGDRVVQFLAAYTGNPVLAQDLAQDTFLTVRAWHERHPAAEVTPGLFFITARNLARDEWRRRAREQRALTRSLDRSPPDEPDKRIVLRDLLDLLRPAEREALVLFYYGDLSTQEIARRLHVKPATVRVRLLRARDKLRKLWQGAEKGGQEHGISR